jgi:hypothetical protein
MANFMGPMAPPQAAPQTPPQLDIRTNPGQRAQFKTFMQGMSRPAAPPTTAPIAPMLPAPTPAEQIDIFAPVPMANGGLADPFDRPSPKMVGGTTNLIDASGSNTGGGSSDPISSMDLYDVAMANPPLPITGTPAMISALDASMGMHNQRTDAAMDRMSVMGDALRASTPVAKMRDFASGILGATQMDGPMGSTFGIKPVTRDGNLGIMANFTVPFEDGGPVRMFMGGDPQAYGEERGRQDTSETAQERQRVGGTTNVFEGDSAPGGGDGDDSVDQAVAAVQQMEAAQQLRDDINDSLRAEIAAQNPVDLTFGAPRISTSGRNTEGDLDRTMDQATLDDYQNVDDVVNSILAVDKTQQFDDLLGDVFVSPSVDPMTDPYRGMGAGDFDFGPALPRDADIINNLLNRRVNYTTRSGNVIDRTVQDDLIERGKPSGLPGFIGKGLDIFGANKAGKYLDQIAGGAPGVIDAKTGQLVGYVGEGFIKGTQTFSGRPGYNPFTGDAQNVRFDPSTNSYIVTPGQPNQGEDDQQRNRVSSTPLPTTDTTDTTPPPVTPPVVTPPVMPDPMNVVVPSTRVADPLGLTPPAFAPVQSVGLPQSFLDLLASFNRPAPVAMQEGGAVLDQAAGNFLEALKVA